MARRLSGDRCELRINDRISGTDLVMYFRQPTTRQRIGYSTESLQRKGNKVKFRQSETRLKYGKRICVGIRDGDFEIPDGNGTYVPLSSDPQSRHYKENWPDLIEQYASDLLELLAIHVFDAPAVIADADDDDADDDDDDDDDDEESGDEKKAPEEEALGNSNET